MRNKRIASSKRELLEKLYRATEANGDEDSCEENGAASQSRNSRRGGKTRSEGKRVSGSSDVKQHPSAAPILLGCALSCFLTVGIMKADAIVPMINSVLSNQATRPDAPAARSASSAVAVSNTIANPLPRVNETRVNSLVSAAASSSQFARIDGLTASKSTITGFTDARSMSAGYYWTLVLSNAGNAQQEARMRLAIPPGATVSRATLWVNGIAQEAAFSTSAQVTSAYEWVRNGRQPRPLRVMADPLVITQEDASHVLVKAAPVEPGGGELKLRIGFTAPLRPSGNSASLELPHIEESNFNVAAVQDVHLQSTTQPHSNQNAVTTVTDSNGGFLLRGNIRAQDLASLKINVDELSSATTFATRATHSPPGTFILASWNKTIDGRTSMSLRKTTALPPHCPIIDSEAAAARLSTLWAHAQIDALVRRQQFTQANELAVVYRVVSSVSGATVLELDSDYAMTGLSRDMYMTTRLGGQPGNAADAVAMSAPKAPSAPSPRRAMQSAPVAPEASDSFTNKRQTDKAVADDAQISINFDEVQQAPALETEARPQMLSDSTEIPAVIAPPQQNSVDNVNLLTLVIGTLGSLFTVLLLAKLFAGRSRE